MKIIVFDKNTKKGEFINYGYGKLSKLSKCEIVEELNGRYDVEIIVGLNETKQKYLKKWAIVYVDGQLFRIINRIDDDKSNNIKIFAKHIFYDINYGFIEDNRADKKNVKGAMEIAIPTDFKNIFEVDSDIETLNTIYFVKNNGAESIFGIIDRWQQGELIRDNFKIKINKNKGRDKGVTFTYKKIDALEVNEDTDNVVTRLYPVGKDGIILEEKYITIPGWNQDNYPPFHITREIKFEGAESTGELRVLARKEAEKIGLSRVNFKINVHDLKNTYLYEYKDQLMNVEVGDIVSIKHSKLNVRVKVKCIKKTIELVTKKIVLEFGQPLESFFDAVDNSNNQVVIPDMSKYEDHMFFYFNNKAISLKHSEVYSLCHLVYGVNDQTNLMLYFNIFLNAKTNCNIKVYFKIDNVLLNFSPIITTEAGYRNISFTYPLIGTEGGKAHTLNAALQLLGGGDIFVPEENIQIIIKGQNVSGSMKEGPHAEVEETYNFGVINQDNIDKKSNVKISIKGPMIIKDNDLKDINNIQFENFDIYEEPYADVYNKGFITGFNERDFIFNKENLKVENDIIQFKDMKREIEFINYPGEFENGFISYADMVDKNVWDSIISSEVSEND